MKNYLMIKTAFLTVALSVAVLINPAHAQEQAALDAAEPITEQEATEEQIALPANITALESMGLYSNPAEGALSRDLWLGSKRSDIVALLKAMPASSPSPQINKLILGVLLTKADAKQIENDVPVEPGADLLTLRLEKLLEAGAYAQAFEIYNQLEDAPYDERLARAGVLAMLYNREKSNACLETKTFMEEFGEIGFWQELSAYCTLTLGGSDDAAALDTLKNSTRTTIYKLATDESFKFLYDPEAYIALSIMEQAILASKAKLDVSAVNAAAVDNIPNAHIQPLLGHEELDPEAQFRLNAHGKAMGLMPQKNIYSSLFRPHHDGEGDEKPLPENNWEKLPHYFEQAEKAPKDQKWAVIQQALPLIEQYGPAAFEPLAPTILQAAPETVTISELTSAVKIMQSADLTISDHWINLIKSTIVADADRKNATVHTALLTTAYFSTTQKDQKTELAKLLHGAAQHAGPHLEQIVDIFMKNIDNPDGSANNLHTVYEKDFFLTYQAGYVMPTSVVWDRLAQASHAKAVGETILLSTVLLRNQTLHTVYPGLLRDIVLSTENVGLTKASRDIAVTASLESLNKEK